MIIDVLHVHATTIVAYLPIMPVRVISRTWCVAHWNASALSNSYGSHTFHTTARNRAVSDDVSWPTSANPTPYEILGLPRNASPEEVKRRYYRLAKQYHPDTHYSTLDRGAEQERLDRFRQIVQANELLSAARKRRLYDSYGYGWGEMNVNDIMADPTHWQGRYEGRYATAKGGPRPRSATFEEGFFQGFRAEPYYTSNANFIGGVIVVTVLLGVIQFSHARKGAEKALEKRREIQEQAALNLRDARRKARRSGRRDMFDEFQRRRDIKPLENGGDDLGIVQRP